MPELQEFAVPHTAVPHRPAKDNRLSTLVILILILLGLLLFYWFLNRPPEAVDKQPSAGINHVFSIYGIDRKDLLSFPNAVYIHDNGDIYVADTGKDRVVVFNSAGRFKSQIKRGDKKLGPKVLVTPLGVTVDSSGRVYTASFDSGVMVFSSSGKLLKQLSIQGTQLRTVGNLVYVTGTGSIYGINNKLEIVRHIGRQGRGLGQFETPQDMLVDKDGKYIVSDSQNMRIQVLDRKGDILAYKGTPPKDMDDAERLFGLGTGIAQDDQGRLYIADALNHVIRIFTQSGDDLGELGGQGDTDGLFNYPSDISYMGGNTFAIADKWNDRVQIVTLNVDDAKAPGGSKKTKAPIPTWTYALGLLILLALIALVARRVLAAREQRRNTQPPIDLSL